MKINIEDAGKKITWTCNSLIISKTYSECLLGYEILPDNSGILLLEPYKIVGSENAIIYNKDGTERWRLPYTTKSGKGTLFDRVGISNNQLTVVAIINNRDVGFIVDFNACKYMDIFNTR